MKIAPERQITMLFANMKLTPLLLIASGVFLITVIALVLTETVWSRKAVKKTGPNIVSGIAMILAIFSASVAISSGMLWKTATKHGYAENNHKMTIEKVWNGVDKSVEESKLPDDITGKIIIYYKFGCPDCEAIFDQLHEAVKNEKDVYWIATRSQTGVALRETYPVKEVPAGLYIKDEGIFVELQLYKKQDGQSVLDTENLDKLLSYLT